MVYLLCYVNKHQEKKIYINDIIVENLDKWHIVIFL